MSSKIEDYVKIYKEISAVPLVTSTTILPGYDENKLYIHSVWSAQDLDSLEKTVFSRDYTFDKVKSKVISTGIPYDTISVSKQAFSKSGKKQAILREKKSAKKSSKNSKSSKDDSTENYDLEIWNEFRKVKTFEMTDPEDHGKINKNALGFLAWSSDEKNLLYIAEAKKMKTSSYFKVDKIDKQETKEEDKEKAQNPGQEYVYREEWGEDLVGSHHSVLAILNVESEKIKVISVDGLSIGEAIWGPGDQCIVFVGYNEFPRRLGLRTCPIRKSGIYVYDCQTLNTTCISGDEDIAVRLPRFSPDFKTLIYFQNSIGGPHFKGSKLQKYDWETKQISTLVDTVDSAFGGEFPGLYVDSIPEHCWFDNHLFISTQCRSCKVILSINVDIGLIQKIEPNLSLDPMNTEKQRFGSCVVYNIHEDFIVAEASSLNMEPCLIIGHLQKTELSSEISIKWQYLDHNAPVKHNDIEWKVIKMNENNADLYFEFILVTPSASKMKSKTPVIIRAHGGPHCAYIPSFSKHITAFTKLNYVNCLINYRGSSGYGENFINSLPGNVGVHDVEDVQQVSEWLKKQSDIPVGDFFYTGGSHGGFLGAHLVGQYPDFYKAVVLLNPALDMAGMTEATDIPDWCFVEGGCGDMFDPSVPITPENLKLMWERSPIKYAANVKTPVLLLLGSKDLRVPYSQGLKYYRLLKARKVDVGAYVYEDCHSLRKTPHDADVFMQTVLWFEKYSS